MGSLAHVKKNKGLIKDIFKISLPSIIDLLAQSLLSFFDMTMVGIKGPSAISAVGLGSAAMNVILPAFMSIGIGTVAILSRAYGANNKKEAKESISQSLILCIPLSIIVTLIFLIFGSQIVNIIGGNKDLDIVAATSYQNIVSLGYFPLSFTVIFLSAYRSIEKANIPMAMNIASVFMNIILNYIFIFYLDLGVTGAAIATTLSRLIVMFAFVYLTFFTKRYWICMNLKEVFHTNLFMTKRILRISIPASIEQLSLRFGMLIFEMMVISLGNIAYAAHKIATMAESFSFNIGFAFSLAAATLVGKHLGANNPDKAESSGYGATFLSVAVMSTMGLLFFIIPGPIISLFTREPQTKILATQALRIVSFCQPFLAASMVLSGALRGAGSTRSVLFVTFFGIFIVRLPITYLFIYYFKMGLAGAWWVMTIDLVFRSSICYYFFKKGKWRYINV